VARDPDTGARLRYGFVDIATDKAANSAIAALHGTQIDGCKLNVKAREKPVKRPPGAGPPRRPPPRTVTAKRMPRDFTEMASPPRSGMPQFDAGTPSPPARPSQSQMALEGMPEIEPPPRQDFEVVHRPVRRREPTFQVEKRPLPRRIVLPNGKP
jgi:hypothetical protein